MRSLPARIKSWAECGFRPIAVTSWEWFFMRLFFAALVMYIFTDWHPYQFASQPSPTGLARFIDLTFLHHPAAYTSMLWVAGICSLAYVMGWGLPVVLPVLTLANTLVRTYANSQGFTHHGYQLITLTLLTQTLVVWWWYLRGRKNPANTLPLASYLVYYSQGVVAFSYVVSGLTKIINSRGLWLWKSQYICLEVVKSTRTRYYAELDPDLAGDSAWALWLLQHRFAALALFGCGFFLECFAFLALRDRYWALLIGISLVAMHESISMIMQLSFLNHELLDLIFLVNIPYWFWWLAQRMRGRGEMLSA